MNKAVIAKKNSENFLVGYFFKGEIKNLIISLYTFARHCDDIADSTRLTSIAKKNRLEVINNEIKHCLSAKPKNKLIKTLLKELIKHQISYQYIKDLMNGFIQDAKKEKYKNLKELYDYCKLSANSVGRIYLEAHQQYNPLLYKKSDYICTALAMIDMTQDIKEDLNIPRVYIPQSFFKKYNIKIEDIKKRNFTINWQLFAKDWLALIDTSLNKGRDLYQNLSGRFRFEVKIITFAAIYLVKKLKKNNNFFMNNKLSKLDWIIIFLKTFFTK